MPASLAHGRFLVAVGLGTAAFNMQDIVLEPYGAAVLHLPVGATSQLTALVAGGSMLAFALAARNCAPARTRYRLAAWARWSACSRLRP